MPVKVHALDHLVINVGDVGRSAQWYAAILGMEIRVLPKNADKVEWFTADHETAGSDDLCFLTSSTPEQVVAHLKANGVVIEESPVARQGARGTLRSVYCRDPDGSLIEISSYRE
jgi:catechol 2,3-dioxygenase-like lactoylglutathione lyase family enzyme